MADLDYPEPNPTLHITEINPANELEKRVADAFLIFDHHGNKTVDVREIGTILRFLGCVPTEADVNEVISATEFEDSNGTVHLSKFLPFVSQLIAEHKLEPAPPEKLLKAFRVLDQEGKGFVDRDYMTKLITEEGEPFTAEELEEMMAVAVDMATDKIPYENYLNQLLHEPQDSIYTLADKFKNQIRRRTIFKFYRR
ncbi:dynein regulatory complex protein 8 [Ochlerotatus camptorhynchus]|uniref:dynein regulatory complex protein 8 n=1 Tax=Ochlerotatus camptorhynchus TaxID=644619 RepID=UPI0031D3B3F1